MRDSTIQFVLNNVDILRYRCVVTWKLMVGQISVEEYDDILVIQMMLSRMPMICITRTLNEDAIFLSREHCEPIMFGSNRDWDFRANKHYINW